MTHAIAKGLQERVDYLDKVRGFAILVMIVDHIIVQIDPYSSTRYITRISMPLFFLLAGHLARRVHWQRLVGIGMLGLALPLVVPWIDRPNVLVIYALCAPIVVWIRDKPLLSVLPIIAALTLAANGYVHPHGYYDPMSLLALMTVGSIMYTPWFHPAKILPSFVAKIGQWPITIYVTHIIILEIIREMLLR